jgi:hypothetical protein
VRPLDHARLLEFTNALHRRYGSEEIAAFLYAITRMHRPRVIVELGTGYGVTTFWLAQAARENGAGHVWSVDNLTHARRNPAKFRRAIGALRSTSLAHLSRLRPSQFHRAAASTLELARHITFLRRTVNLPAIRNLHAYPFAAKRIDLLFSDISHGPRDILGLCRTLLPSMADVSSLFIDSASTYWPSYRCLEQLMAMLNSGVLPDSLATRQSPRTVKRLLARRYSVIHLTYEGKGSIQNSTAWIKIEPKERRPYPRVAMRRGW